MESDTTKMDQAKQSIPSVGHLSNSLLHFPEWGNAVLLRYCIDAKIHHLTRERERKYPSGRRSTAVGDLLGI